MTDVRPDGGPGRDDESDDARSLRAALNFPASTESEWPRPPAGAEGGDGARWRVRGNGIAEHVEHVEHDEQVESVDDHGEVEVLPELAPRAVVVGSDADVAARLDRLEHSLLALATAIRTMPPPPAPVGDPELLRAELVSMRQMLDATFARVNQPTEVDALRHEIKRVLERLGSLETVVTDGAQDASDGSAGQHALVAGVVEQLRPLIGGTDGRVAALADDLAKLMATADEFAQFEPAWPVEPFDELRAQLDGVVTGWGAELATVRDELAAMREELHGLRTRHITTSVTASDGSEQVEAIAIDRLDHELVALREALVALKNERVDRSELVSAANHLMDLRLEGWARNLNDVKALLTRLLGETTEH